MALRRLRARLDQVQGNANHTMGLAQDLIADLQDGFGLTITLDDGAATKLFHAVTSGKACELPIRIKIDPTIDTKE
jgi:hypothetical protein